MNNKKLHHAGRMIAKYTKKQMKSKEISSSQRRIRLARKYKLLKTRIARNRTNHVNKRLFYKKKLGDLRKEKKDALNNLQAYLQKEIRKSAEKARKKRVELQNTEKTRKDRDAKTGNYWLVNHNRLETLRAEKKFRSKLYFKFKRDTHYLGALFRKRARILAQVKKQFQRDAKYRSSTQFNRDQAKAIELEWAAEKDAKKKAKLHTKILLAQSSADRADRRVKKAAKLSDRAQAHIKLIDEKLRQVVEHSITDFKVKQFPKRIIEQLQAQQIQNQVLKPRLYAYYQKLLKKMEKSGSFFLLQPTRKESRYVCTTTEDLVDKPQITPKNPDKINLDPLVRNVILRPLICFVKNPVSVVATYTSNSENTRPLKITIAPSAWRQARLTFKKVKQEGKKHKTLMAMVKKSKTELDPEYKDSIKVTEMSVDTDVRKHMLEHANSAKALLNTFYIERVPLPSEPFVLQTNIAA
jgi:hypothetical protein